MVNNYYLLDTSLQNIVLSYARSRKERNAEFKRTDFLAQYNKITHFTEYIRRSYRTFSSLHKIILVIVKPIMVHHSPAIDHFTTIAKGLNYSYFVNSVTQWYYDKNAKWTQTGMTMCSIFNETLGIVTKINPYLPYALSATAIGWIDPLRLACDTSLIIFYKLTQLSRVKDKENAIKKVAQSLEEMTSKKETFSLTPHYNDGPLNTLIQAQQLKLESLTLEREKALVTGRWLNMIIVAKTIEIAKPILIKIGLAYVSGFPLMLLGFAISAYGLYKMYHAETTQDAVEEKMDQAFRLTSSIH